MRRKKGYFSISAVAEMFSIHPQTIRLYEQEGLISPKRTDGNTRLFSEEDVDKLEEIVYLTHHLGINLAGVEMVLKLKKQIKKMQKEMNAVFDEASNELSKQEDASKSALNEDITRLMSIRKPRLTENKPSTPAQEESSSIDLGEWEIEYEK
jgi:MerR family transcriptional regulator/heat shock protein HspR